MRPYETPTAQALWGGMRPTVVECQIAALANDGMTAVTAEDLPRARLPFPLAWFEYAVPAAHPMRSEGCASVGALLMATTNDQIFMAVHFFSHDGALLLLRAFSTVLDPESGRATKTCLLQASQTIAGRMDAYELTDDERSSLAQVASPIWYAIGMMHCRNVRMVEATVPRGIIRKRRRQGVAFPLVKFSRIVIDRPASQGLKTATGDHGVALHFCRGHFRTYSEEKPLFGSRTGTFWIPHHARGDVGRGIVTQRYQS